MSRGKLRSLRNQQNAQHSTGPVTPEGKQRSRMNAFKHNLTGNNLILQQHELQAYTELTAKMLADLKPESEPERQIAQKIIDLDFRLNRITAIENNMLNFDLMQHERVNQSDDRTEVMLAQTRAWKADAHSFDLLGRYEGRLSKQLLQYQKELERLQTLRKIEADNEARRAAWAEREEAEAKEEEAAQTEPLNPDVASFGEPVHEYVMSASSESVSQPPLPPPARLRVPEPPVETAA